MIMIREATTEDAVRLLEIYGYYVRNTAITFEYETPSPQFKSINSLALSLLHSPTLTSIHYYWKNYSFERETQRDLPLPRGLGV